MKLMLGIDTGGTYTDAAIVDDSTGAVLATAKVPTTHDDLARGVAAVVDAALADLDLAGDGPSAIGLVSVSTTLATNALVEGHGEPAALIVAGLDDDEVARLRAETDDPVLTIAGGHDALGNELCPIEGDEVVRLAEETATRVGAYAVATQFSVRTAAHELAVAEILAATTGHPVTCSHELSNRLDAPRRARTALLNARLIAMITRLEASVRSTLAAVGISAPLMVVRGDGSLAAADLVARRPIETILSGPAASVVGALHLSRGSDPEPAPAAGLVVDVGGTTTDIAALIEGRPALAEDGAVVAGHRTMVEAVDLATHGLGGDSEVRVDAGRTGVAGGDLTIGPERALPLSRLALDRPELLDRLREQLVAADPVALPARLWIVAEGVDEDRSPPDLDDRDRSVLARARTPVPEEVLAPTNLARRRLGRLRRRGLIRLSTFTPTDAAVVLGHVGADPGSGPEGERAREAAVAGAELLARRRDRSGRPLADSPTRLAARVEDLVVERSARHVLDAALRADGFEPDDRSDRPVLDAGLRAHRGLLAMSIGLDVPIIAVGASAGAYYRRVAERLGTTVVVPHHADVANAVGAVVGRIRVEAAVVVTRPRAGSYVLGGVMLDARDRGPFRSLDDARRHGEAVLTDHLGAVAERAGAAEVELAWKWDERTATVEGSELLVEATLTAVASGRPRLG